MSIKLVVAIVALLSVLGSVRGDIWQDAGYADAYQSDCQEYETDLDDFTNRFVINVRYFNDGTNTFCLEIYGWLGTRCFGEPQAFIRTYWTVNNISDITTDNSFTTQYDKQVDASLINGTYDLSNEQIWEQVVAEFNVPDSSDKEGNFNSSTGYYDLIPVCANYYLNFKNLSKEDQLGNVRAAIISSPLVSVNKENTCTPTPNNTYEDVPAVFLNDQEDFSITCSITSDNTALTPKAVVLVNTLTAICTSNYDLLDCPRTCLFCESDVDMEMIDATTCRYVYQPDTLTAIGEATAEFLGGRTTAGTILLSKSEVAVEIVESTVSSRFMDLNPDVIDGQGSVRVFIYYGADQLYVQDASDDEVVEFFYVLTPKPKEDQNALVGDAGIEVTVKVNDTLSETVYFPCTPYDADGEINGTAGADFVNYLYHKCTKRIDITTDFPNWAVNNEIAEKRVTIAGASANTLKADGSTVGTTIDVRSTKYALFRAKEGGKLDGLAEDPKVIVGKESFTLTKEWAGVSFLALQGYYLRVVFHCLEANDVNTWFDDTSRMGDNPIGRTLPQTCVDLGIENFYKDYAFLNILSDNGRKISVTLKPSDWCDTGAAQTVQDKCLDFEEEEVYNTQDWRFDGFLAIYKNETISGAPEFEGILRVSVVFANCFSPDSMITLESGDVKALRDVKIGDRVLSVGSNGQPEYSAVWWKDEHPGSFSPFRKLEYKTASGATGHIEVSLRHLIYISGKSEPVPALSVKVGDELLVMDQGSLVPATVSDISTSLIENGMNIYTLNDRVVVNNAMASSLTTHSNVPTWLFPVFKSVYGVAPSVMKAAKYLHRTISQSETPSSVISTLMAGASA